MKGHISLIDLDFKSFSTEEKRYFLMMLDLCMKRYHQHGFLVTSFDPKDIYYENKVLYFDKVEAISPMNSNDKEDAILNNVASLSNLAFCSYLPAYNLKNGLLNVNVVSENFEKYKYLFNDVDFEYYRSIFQSLKSRKLPVEPYYYDFVSQHEKDNNSKGNSNSMAYIKATQAGKLYASQFEDQSQAAFGNTFFFITVLTAMMILLTGVILYFINI